MSRMEALAAGALSAAGNPIHTIRRASSRVASELSGCISELRPHLHLNDRLEAAGPEGLVNQLVRLMNGELRKEWAVEERHLRRREPLRDKGGGNGEGTRSLRVLLLSGERELLLQPRQGPLQLRRGELAGMQLRPEPLLLCPAAVQLLARTGRSAGRGGPGHGRGMQDAAQCHAAAAMPAYGLWVPATASAHIKLMSAHCWCWCSGPCATGACMHMRYMHMRNAE